MNKLRGVDGETYRVVVLPDTHVPYHDVDAVAAIVDFLADETVDELIQLGDYMDNDLISHHNKKKLQIITQETMFSQYTQGRQLLELLVGVTRQNNHAAKVTIIEGNHDAWLNDHWVQANPQWAGVCTTENLLGLKNLGVNFISDGHLGGSYLVGKMAFTHGLVTSSTHARTMAMRWGYNVGYGHTHDAMSYVLEQHGRDSVIIAQSHGCLCDLEPPFMKKRPSNWQLAFGDYRFRPDGTFNHCIYRIFDGVFTTLTGKTYGKLKRKSRRR